MAKKPLNLNAVPDDPELKQAMTQLQDNTQPINKDRPVWYDTLRVTSNGGVKINSLRNIRTVLENDPLLRDLVAYDEFAGQLITTRDVPRLQINAGYWTDANESVVRAYIDDQHELLFDKRNLSDAVIAVAKRNKVNPVKSRIETVPWDGTPRAERLFIDYVGADDSHYTRSITKIWLTGLIARVYQPGIKFEIVPILQGPQGLGKSTILKKLFPDHFNDSLKSMGRNKDDYQQLQGKLIVELGELSALNKSEVELTKNFISSPSDTYRGSYEHYSTPHPRKCVFIGTTNHQDYLKDATGERRFYPIKCGVSKSTKNPWYPDQSDLLQILAETKTWFDSGVQIYPDKRTLEEAKPYQDEASVIDVQKDAIEDYLNMNVPTNWDELGLDLKQRYFQHYGDEWDYIKNKTSATTEPIKHTTTREIMAVVFHKTADRYLSGRTNAEAKTIKLKMDNMPNWQSQRIRINGQQVRGYIRTQ